MHQEKPRISQVERSAHHGRVKLVNVTGKQRTLPSCSAADRPGPAGWAKLAEVDANHTRPAE
jgi:hypothetical protein